ncbi:MAG: tripartite tricarboxylate transporter TctB family protein [Alphaproteobacteria bacterium]|nr:tripartite tricarboxylate transporter TctB family protein [Alphaproteobacteria bacterium]
MMASKPGSGGFRMANLRGGQDVVSGLLFAAIGAGGLIIARNYPMGTPIRLGTGVFPVLLCWGLIGIGLLIAVKGLVVDGPRLDGWAMRPLIYISLAIIAFSELIDRTGLLIAMVALMVLGGLGSPETKPREFTIFSVMMIVIAYLMFILGLEMPIRMFPWN